MEKDKVKIISQYEKSGEMMYLATLNGDYKTNNREGKKLIRIFKLFESDLPFAYECIQELLKSENVVVRKKAAAYCLALNWNIAEAEEILTAIAADPDTGIFGFNAEMILKVWRTDGTLKMYQK